MTDKKQLSACTECSEHFGITVATFPDDAVVWLVSDRTMCDYHTDFTGRPQHKERLMTEWSANHPEGWASV